MGGRRVRDLLGLGIAVVGADARSERREQAQARFEIRTVQGFDDLVAAGVDAVVIATPPDQHVEFYELCYANRLAFFSEANILTPKPTWFAEREGRSGVRGYPSATWSHHPLFGILKREIASLPEANVHSVHHQLGTYLPRWHPWESYADFYAGRRLTSAAREMVPFEMEWIVDVFGEIHSVFAYRGARAKWQTDIDDTYSLALELRSGVVGTMQVEVHHVEPFRIARISCAGASYALDLGRHELRCYSAVGDTERCFRAPGSRPFESFDFEDVYRSEIAAFVAAVRGEAGYDKTWARDRHLSDILFAAEVSHARRAWVEVDEAHGLYDGLSCEPPAEA